jgi:hypothetical protein
MSRLRYLLPVLAVLGPAPLDAGAAQTRREPDSANLLAGARAAQRDFEVRRRQWLPAGWSAGGRCDERIGRFCYWYDDRDTTLPGEPPRVADDRARLLAELAGVHALLPGDGWLLGQRVRYLVEHGDTAAAAALTAACPPDGWWCHALAGYARHAAGRYAEAEAAFDLALATMPADLRCEWTDWEVLLEGGLDHRFRALACDARGPLADSVLWLGTPLLSRPGNDLRTELLSRRVIDRMLRASRSPQGLPWGRDVAELVLRYGWPVRWTVADRRHPAALDQPSVVGHDPTPAYAFLPVPAGDGAAPWQFTLRRERPRARYAPPWTGRITDLDRVQVARFPRGEASRVVLAATAGDDPAFRGPGAELAAAVSAGPGAPAAVARAPLHDGTAVAVVTTHRAARLAGIEIRSGDGRRYLRHRTLLPALDPAPGPGLSDLLLFEPGDLLPVTLAEAAGRALPTARWRRGRPVGVYWEMSGGGADSVEVSVSVVPERRGVLGRIGQSMSLVRRRAPLTLQWTVPGAGGPVAGRAIELDLARLDAGRYTLVLAARQPGGPGQTSTREIELLK